MRLNRLRNQEPGFFLWRRPVKDELSEDSQDGACILSALRIPLES
jgi:hypothetical protein